MIKRSRNLDVALVRTFAAVADRASMTAAANLLNLTQGAVSQQIGRLEQGFGAPLFKRSRRGLRLTSAGERLLGNAKRLLEINDEIWGDMATAQLGGEVRIGVPQDLIGSVLAPILKTYTDARPQVEVSLVCTTSLQLMQALEEGSLDLAVIEEPVGPTSGETARVERLVWVGARGGVAHRKRPLPISMVADTCAFRPLIIETLDSNGLPWRAMFESGNIEATTGMVRSDLAVTAWLAPTVPVDLNILTAESGLPDLPSFAINLHLPRHQVNRAATEFAHHVRDGLMRHSQAA
jgi:DNA-binding transcriptional LysR family regulator